MSTPKLTRAEAMRKTIQRSREDAIAALSPEDKVIYDNIVAGDSDASRAARKAELGTPLYDASNYVLADYFDLIESIRRLDAPEDTSGQQAAVPGGAPAASPFPGLPGIPVGGLPGFPGLPGMGAPMPAPGASPAPAAAAPVGASQTTVEDVKELLDAWQHRYGTCRGVFEQDIIDKAIKSQNKELVVELIDRDIFRLDSVQEVKFEKPGKTYIGEKQFDVKKVPMFEYLMASQTTVLLEILTEHPTGKAMFLKAAQDSQYGALRFAFDTQNKPLLQGLLDTKVDISNMRELEFNTPLMCDFIYRVEEADEEQLRMLIEYGANMTDTDQLLSTPLMVAARVGNLPAMKLLMEYDMHDLYAKNLHGETILTLVEAGPARRKEAQESHDEAVTNAKERYEELKQAWEVQARAAEAAGKKPPAEPKEPKFKDRPADYPVELIALVQDAWIMGDPSQSKQALLIAQNNKPDDFAMDFDAAF